MKHLRPGAVGLVALLLGALAVLTLWQAADRGRAAGLQLPMETRDLNAATTRELAATRGLGTKLAARLAARRTSKGGFARWEDMVTIRGLGPRKLERLSREWNLGGGKAGAKPR